MNNHPHHHHTMVPTVQAQPITTIRITMLNIHTAEDHMITISGVVISSRHTEILHMAHNNNNGVAMEEATEIISSITYPRILK